VPCKPHPGRGKTEEVLQRGAALGQSWALPDSDGELGGIYLVPFEAAPAACFPTRFGICSQGFGGRFSHTGALFFSADFELPVGTAVLAARSGFVVDVESSFTEGGVRDSMRSKANFVVLRHDNGLYTRYFHLAPEGVSCCVGDWVSAGANIGRSGATGYCQGPHLHFDVVDCYDSEVAVLEVTQGPPDSATELCTCSVASFGGLVPEDGEALGPWECASGTADMDVKDACIVGFRDGEPFWKKAEAAQQRGAKALIVVNNEARPKLCTLGAPPKFSTDIPVLLCPESCEAALMAPESRVRVFRHPHFVARVGKDARQLVAPGIGVYEPLTVPFRLARSWRAPAVPVRAHRRY